MSILFLDQKFYLHG